MKQLQNAIGMRLALMVGGLSLSDLKREDGQTFAEYALVIGVVVLALVAAATVFTGDVSSAFSKVGTDLLTAV